MNRKHLPTMIFELNTLRAKAGLTPAKIVGTNKATVQVMINKAKRDEF